MNHQETAVGWSAPSPRGPPVSDRTKVRILKVAIWLGALAPLAWCVAGYFEDWLGANPIEKLEHVTGHDHAASRCWPRSPSRPLRRLTGWNPLIKRAHGPSACSHSSTPSCTSACGPAWTRRCVWSWMKDDIVKRPYITVGFTGFVLLIPLALTSTKGWIRRLGKKWTTLHRLVYVTRRAWA